MNILEHQAYRQGIEAVSQVEFDRCVRHLCEMIAEYPHLWLWGDGYGGYVKRTLEDAFSAWDFPRPPEPEYGTNNSGRNRAPISRTKTIAVMQKSDSKCVNCDSTEDLQIDHIVPHSRGGSNDLSNLQMLCRSCNASKGAKTMDEWLGGDE